MNLPSVSALLVVGVLIAAVSGCQTAPKINAEFDKSADFIAAKTFAVRPFPANIPGVDPGLVLRVGPAATTAARTAMAAKGYVEMPDAAKADLAVLVHGKSVPKTDVTDWGFTPYYGRASWHGAYSYGVYGGSSVSVDQYNEGTLIVEVYDVKTHNMIWVGWVTARADVKPDEQAARISEAIAKVLANYPSVGHIPVAPAAK